MRSVVPGGTVTAALAAPASDVDDGAAVFPELPPQADASSASARTTGTARDRARAASRTRNIGTFLRPRETGRVVDSG
jgi:hypothetical protein